jgi:hypothetical protein
MTKITLNSITSALIIWNLWNNFDAHPWTISMYNAPTWTSSSKFIYMFMNILTFFNAQSIMSHVHACTYNIEYFLCLNLKCNNPWNLLHYKEHCDSWTFHHAKEYLHSSSFSFDILLIAYWPLMMSFPHKSSWGHTMIYPFNYSL